MRILGWDQWRRIMGDNWYGGLGRWPVEVRTLFGAAHLCHDHQVVCKTLRIAAIKDCISTEVVLNCNKKSRIGCHTVHPHIPVAFNKQNTYRLSWAKKENGCVKSSPECTKAKFMGVV